MSERTYYVVRDCGIKLSSHRTLQEVYAHLDGWKDLGYEPQVYQITEREIETDDTRH